MIFNDRGTINQLSYSAKLDNKVLKQRPQIAMFWRALQFFIYSHKSKQVEHKMYYHYAPLRASEP